MAEIIEQLFAVFHAPQIVGEPAFFQRLLGEQAVVRVIVSEQEGDGFVFHARTSFACLSGKVTPKVKPSPGVLFAGMLTPLRSPILRQMGHQMPVPSSAPGP